MVLSGVTRASGEVVQPAHDDLNANANLQVGDVDVSAGNPVPVTIVGGGPILEGGLTELIGVDERVDQNEYGASVGVALAATYSGEILSFTLTTSESGTGAVLTPTGKLYIFDADPTIAAGDVSMTTAERRTVLGKVHVSAGDWTADANGATAYIVDTPVAFHALGTLYFAWWHEDAVSFNDAAGDDEQLQFDFEFRRDS